MLLLHQTGSVKIGEVLRYTVTYTPANDRILPAPSHLFLKVKNTSTVALRAAFIHGPYTLYVSSEPASFKVNEKCANPRRDGIPEFEPNLKAGGTWYSKLCVPEDIRQTAGNAKSRDDGSQKSVTWIIEVASQVIFSTSASVHYEILLGRDEKSLSLGFMGGSTYGIPGQVSDHQQSKAATDGHHSAQTKGVFSKAIKLKVEDTASLWNTPDMPGLDDAAAKELDNNRAESTPTAKAKTDGPSPPSGNKKKNVHLVLLTHGLHSNLGADMLYMKESIDEATRQAKQDRRKRRRHRSEGKKEDKHPSEHIQDGTEDSDDEEEVVVRGFSGNAVKTEKGIKYLGKRLAKYVLRMTYPDQPCKPVSKSAAKALQRNEKDEHGLPVHRDSTIHEVPSDRHGAYKITSISFISHSLGGLIQTYAVAYIQKHSPQFFDIIKPINFVALATPFLGLSNENPLYVKFALDFGLVGRTGQDLGLTWRAPTIAKSGWSALVGGIGDSAQHKLQREHDPGAKPLLRILPTGPAHIALKKFRNRTVYSNVVNDGIVPLRTSCLLFLDWSGLGKVEKARRENGLVGTMAGWGWSELTGSNANQSRHEWTDDEHERGGSNTPTREGKGDDVPQPPDNATDFDARSMRVQTNSSSPSNHRQLMHHQNSRSISSIESDSPQELANASGTQHNIGALDSLLGLFKSHPSPQSHKHSPKHTKIYRRSQTLNINTDDQGDGTTSPDRSKSPATAGDAAEGLSAPPKTTFFEAAGDLLAPPIVPVSFLIDPEARPRTIFHDRVYHPADIPPPPLKRRSTSLFGSRRNSSNNIDTKNASQRLSSTESSTPLDRNWENDQIIDDSAMKVEEKIARAYHRDLAWRKVLVRLEPDAHNNMIVRRKFANAYGWPVVKHLVDTHFSDSREANMPDDEEGSQDNAKDGNEAAGETGNETHTQDRFEEEEPASRDHDSKGSPTSSTSTTTSTKDQKHIRTRSELRESADTVPALNSLRPGNLARVLEVANTTAENINTNSLAGDGKKRPVFREREDSATWSERDWADSDGDDSENESNLSASSFMRNLHLGGLSVPSSSALGLGNAGANEMGNGDKSDASGAAATGGWNWTEAIAGRKLAGTSAKEGLKSPRLAAQRNSLIRDVGTPVARNEGQPQRRDEDIGLDGEGVAAISGTSQP